MSKTRVLNRLNGIKLSEEKLVELRQDTAETRTTTLDLASLLSKSEDIKTLKLGEDAILKDIALSVDSNSLQLTVSTGKVIREDNGAVLKALQDMLNSKA